MCVCVFVRMCVCACVRNTFLKTGNISVAPAKILVKTDTLVPWTPATLFSVSLPSLGEISSTLILYPLELPGDAKSVLPFEFLKVEWGCLRGSVGREPLASWRTGQEGGQEDEEVMIPHPH